MSSGANNDELRDSISLTRLLSDEYRNYVEQVEKNGQTVSQMNTSWKTTSKLIEEYNNTISSAHDIYEDTGDLLKQQLKDTEKIIETVAKKVKLNEADKQKLLETLKARRDEYKEMVKQQAVQDTITSKAGEMLDGLESQVKKIPIVGDILASTIDFGGLKKEMGGILGGITKNFMSLKAGGMSTGAALSQSFGAALPLLKQFGKMLLASLGPIMLVVAALYLIKKAFDFNEETTKLAKDLGISVDEARSMEESFNQTSGSSKNLAVNTKSLVEAQTQLSKATGMTAQFSEQMLTDQINLTKYMGLSGDEAANFQKIAMSNGQTAREMQGEIAGSVEQFNNATGASVSLKDVVQDIAKLPTAIRVGFKGTTGELAKTVAMAKVMGTTLEKSSAAADKSLDIESSLKAEAKARMLTGININNNEIRAAQLAGDGAKVLELQKRELEKISNFNDMAPYQQKAIADAMGMTVEEVVAQKDAMEMAKRANIDLSTATLDQLKNAEGLTKEEKDKLIRSKEQMSAQEKLSAMQEKFGDLINSIVAGPLGEMVGLIVDSLIPAFDVIMAVLNPIFSIIGFIFKIFVGINKITMAIGEYIRSLFYPIFESIGEAVDNIKKPFEDLFANFNSGEGSKFMDGLKETGKFLLDYIFTPIKMTIGFISSVIGGIGKAIATYITGNIQSVMDIFSGIGMILDGDIMGGLEMIGSSILDILLSPFKLLANLLISVFNGVIGGINAISFDVPSWVPVIGGTTFTPGIPEIPQLAEGGIVQSSTIAEVGEAGPEAVVPLDTFFSKLGEMVNPSEFMSNIPNPLDVVGGALDGIGNLFGGGSSSTGIDYDKLAEAISKQPIVITVDGKVVSEITRVQSKQSSFRK
jgi:methyl-accepting chemotaxis protein